MWVNARAIIERNTERGTEIVVQTRNKPEEAGPAIELPGGRAEAFESLIHALKREVREETGLALTHIEGVQTTVQTAHTDGMVECFQPFAVYQTIKGPGISTGVYFRCHATGTLLTTGDDTEDIRWMPVRQLKAMLRDDIRQFFWVDRAGLLFYLKHCHQWEIPTSCLL